MSGIALKPPGIAARSWSSGWGDSGAMRSRRDMEPSFGSVRLASAWSVGAVRSERLSRRGMRGLAKNAFCILRCDEVHINGLRCRPRRQDLRQEGRTKMSDAPATAAETRPAAPTTDVVGVGAGFAG